MLKIYKREYGQVFESEDNKSWEQEYDYKHLKDLDYQPDQLQQPDQPRQPDQPQQPDQELPLWIESEDRFNGLKHRSLSVKDNELKTSTSDIDIVSMV